MLLVLLCISAASVSAASRECEHRYFLQVAYAALKSESSFHCMKGWKPGEKKRLQEKYQSLDGYRAAFYIMVITTWYDDEKKFGCLNEKEYCCFVLEQLYKRGSDLVEMLTKLGGERFSTRERLEAEKVRVRHCYESALRLRAAVERATGRPVEVDDELALATAIVSKDDPPSTE